MRLMNSASEGGYKDEEVLTWLHGVGDGVGVFGEYDREAAGGETSGKRLYSHRERDGTCISRWKSM